MAFIIFTVGLNKGYCLQTAIRADLITASAQERLPTKKADMLQ